jgi:hypothetical protein
LPYSMTMSRRHVASDVAALMESGPFAGLVLAATAAHTAHYARYGKVDAITRGPRVANLDVYGRAARRSLDHRLFARSDLLGVHLKVSLFVYRAGQLGDVFALIPGDEAHQAVVILYGNVPIQPRAATNDGICVIRIQPGRT